MGIEGRKGYLREGLSGVDGLALAVEVGVAQPVRVVVAAVCIATTVETVLGVGTTAGVVLADVVVVILAGVRSEGVRVGVGLPISSGLAISFLGQSEDRNTYQTSISAQQDPMDPTPAWSSVSEASHPSMLPYS